MSTKVLTGLEFSDDGYGAIIHYEDFDHLIEDYLIRKGFNLQKPSKEEIELKQKQQERDRET